MAVKNQVPTGQMERELRAAYLRWLTTLDADMTAAEARKAVGVFEATSRGIITKLGGQAASLGALAGFPVPKVLELSPVAGVVYDEMKQAAVKASIIAGLNSTDAARQMFNAGLDSSFKRLNRLARTETVSAYWKNTWDSVAEMDELVLIWGSEIGPKTCDYCLERDGLVVEDDSIRDHPQGRCTLKPTLRSKVDYKGTLNADGSITQDPAWGAKRKSTKDPKAGNRGQSISNTDDFE